MAGLKLQDIGVFHAAKLYDSESIWPSLQTNWIFVFTFISINLPVLFFNSRSVHETNSGYFESHLHDNFHFGSNNQNRRPQASVFHSPLEYFRLHHCYHIHFRYYYKPDVFIHGHTTLHHAVSVCPSVGHILNYERFSHYCSLPNRQRLDCGVSSLVSLLIKSWILIWK